MSEEGVEALHRISSRPSDKNSLQINMLEHVPIAKPASLAIYRNSEIAKALLRNVL